jgi:hypothetical protein
MLWNKSQEAEDGKKLDIESYKEKGKLTKNPKSEKGKGYTFKQAKKSLKGKLQDSKEKSFGSDIKIIQKKVRYSREKM